MRKCVNGKYKILLPDEEQDEYLLVESHYAHRKHGAYVARYNQLESYFYSVVIFFLKMCIIYLINDLFCGSILQCFDRYFL